MCWSAISQLEIHQRNKVPPNLAACIKGGLQLQGYAVGDPLAPQAPLSPEGVDEVGRALRAIGAL